MADYRRIVFPLLVLLTALRLGQMAVNESFYAPGPERVTQDIVIPPGGSAEIAATLQKAGVLEHPLIFRLAAFFTRQNGPLRAGEYRFPARSSLADMLDILRQAEPVQHQVTIPEGLTGAQIAAILNAAPLASGQVEPPADGAVLPQTYDYLWNTPRAAILRRAEAAMQENLAREWAGRDPSVPLASPDEALNLAAIVQAETPVAAELPEIAAVYENRLQAGMKLQADPTVIYAASNGRQSGGAGISRADLANPSMYNTYLYAGLPPGPICAPGLAAIHAVLHPADSDALYFVATGNGGHVFAHDFKQQLRNIHNLWSRQK